MIHSRLMLRQALAGLDNSAGQNIIPPCYALRLIPLDPGQAGNFGSSGRFPVTLTRVNGGEPITVADSSTLYFSKWDESRLLGLQATFSFIAPDNWLVQWTDEPDDWLEPAGNIVGGGPGGAFGPGQAGNTIGITIQEARPVLIGGVDRLQVPRYFEPIGTDATAYYAALRVARRGMQLFDSGLVAAGAAIASPVLDLTAIETLEVIADNVAGAANRLLTLDQYLDDGVTNIDAALKLRSVRPGKRVRGLLSPNAPGETSGVTTLYDVTSAANTALDTGALDFEDFDAIEALVAASAAMAAAPALILWQQEESDGVQHLLAPSTIAAAASQAAQAWGVGSSIGNNTTSGGPSVSLPASGKVTLGAAGAAVTCRLVITGRGRIPGTFSVPMVLPNKAKLTLAAGGAANGRLTIIGR